MPGPNGMLHGYVKDALKSSPVSLATITATMSSKELWSVKSMSDGYYYAPLPPGAVTLKVTAAGYKPYTFKLTVSGGQAYSKNVNLQK